MSFLDDLLGGVAGAGLGFLTGGPVGAVAGGLGGFASAAGAASQRDWAAGQSQAQMDFQERMSSTAWQRGTADMRKAGINPMLAFAQGPASSPAGAMAASPESPLSAGVASALNVMQVKKQLDVLDAQAYASRQKGFSDMTDALLKQLDLGILSSGRQAVPGGPVVDTLRQKILEANLANVGSATALNRAALPGAGVKGSKLAAVWQTLMGGGAAPAAAGAVAKFLP